MNFGENLKKIRNMKKLSQEDLAEKMHVSRQSVSKWETGDAYPEMNNLLELCKIFHCKINDLVNDSIIDIDSLDEDVVKEVISLKKEDQKKMKNISKAVSVISNIGKVACRVSIFAVILSAVAVIFLFKNIEIEDNKIIWDNHIVELELETYNNKVSLKVDGKVIEEDYYSLDEIHINNLFRYKKSTIIIIIEICSIAIIITLYIISLVLSHLNKLFNNFAVLDTPFTLENVSHIKMISWLMIFTIIFTSICEGILEMISYNRFGFSIELFNIVEILFLFSISYIFEYGRLIQIDTNGKIYGDVDE